MASNNMEMLVKLIISEHNVQKLKLNNLTSIDDLKKIVSEKAKIQHEFVLQYLDEDFNDYFNLDDLDNVRHLGTIKVLKSNEDVKVHIQEVQSVKLNPWPAVFPLPDLYESVLIKSHMENLTAKFDENEQVQVPEILRRKIVASLAEQIVKYTYYPQGRDIDNMCRSLIEKYPCLRDSGPGGYSTWCTCVKFKIGNLRKALRTSVPEIACNTGKRSKVNPEAPSPHSHIKKQRAGIVMVPKKSVELDIDESKKTLLNELGKLCPDSDLVKALMGKTWSARWHYIQEGPPISDIFKEWPAYHHEQYVYLDFLRLTNVSLKETFLPAFDELVPKILKMGSSKKELKEKCSSVPDNIEEKREIAVDVLRILLGEKESSPLIKVFNDENLDSMCEVKDCTIVKHHGCYGLVMEKKLLARDISKCVHAVTLMFAYIWILNVQYPKEQKYTWEFIEKVVLKIGCGNKCAKIAMFEQKLNSQ